MDSSLAGHPVIEDNGLDCPLCVAEREAEARFYRWYCLENHGSIPLLERLAAGGFCRRHANRLYARDWHWEISVTYQALIGEYRHQLSEILPILRDLARKCPRGSAKAPSGQSPIARIIGRIKAFFVWLATKGSYRRLGAITQMSTACPVCENRSLSAKCRLRELGEEAAAGRDQPPLLCRPHLWQVVKELPPDLAIRFVERARDSAATIGAGLDEFFRKAEWRNRHEPKGGEQSAWIKAMNLYDALASVQDGALADNGSGVIPRNRYRRAFCDKGW